MKNTNNQIFLDKITRSTEVKYDGFELSHLGVKAKPKLVVTRAILQTRCFERRIQACTPTLLYFDLLAGGKHG
ncbi:MAG: hypothetical protein COA91_13880 [Robiginitomaculum sp.]|nr:MAG: hypothetical protein COA91_13880 [Robiginitomaculum sp.]